MKVAGERERERENTVSRSESVQRAAGDCAACLKFSVQRREYVNICRRKKVFERNKLYQKHLMCATPVLICKYLCVVRRVLRINNLSCEHVMPSATCFHFPSYIKN